MRKSKQTWTRGSAVFQTKCQNGEDIWSLDWNNCWCQTGWVEYLRKSWSPGIFTRMFHTADHKVPIFVWCSISWKWKQKKNRTAVHLFKLHFLYVYIQQKFTFFFFFFLPLNPPPTWRPTFCSSVNTSNQCLLVDNLEKAILAEVTPANQTHS